MFRTLARRLGLQPTGQIDGAIRLVPRRNAELSIASLQKSDTVEYVSDETSLSEGWLHSDIARCGRLESAPFRKIIDDLHVSYLYHRKLWEMGYILQALEDRGKIFEGSRGLAFAVGQERTPAYLAARGCEIVASDLSGDDDRSEAWKQTAQWSDSLDGLMFPSICEEQKFRERVSFRAVDMNDIPDDLRDFDFTWSACSFEHCGSIELGLRFVREQMKCLKPGGIAVHTTEFNLTSNDDTLEHPATVIFRLKDIERVVQELTAEGHHVEPLDVRLGDHELDLHVDRPEGTPSVYSHNKHMRLELDGYASTSIGLIITKGGETGSPSRRNGGLQ